MKQVFAMSSIIFFRHFHLLHLERERKCKKGDERVVLRNEEKEEF